MYSETKTSKPKELKKGNFLKKFFLLFLFVFTFVGFGNLKLPLTVEAQQVYHDFPQEIVDLIHEYIQYALGLEIPEYEIDQDTLRELNALRRDTIRANVRIEAAETELQNLNITDIAERTALEDQITAQRLNIESYTRAAINEVNRFTRRAVQINLGAQAALDSIGYSLGITPDSFLGRFRDSRIPRYTPPPPVNPEINCGSWLGGYDYPCLLANMAYHIVLTPSASILDISGRFFDFVLTFTVLQMKTYVFPENGFSAVNFGWEIVRDFVNIAFIFVILFLAIKTIINGTGETGKEIVHIIMIALFINFSLFFTKFVIDVGNMTSIAIYNTVAGESGTIANSFIEKSGAATVLATGSRVQSTQHEYFNRHEMNMVTIIKQSLAGSVIMLVVAFVLFMATFLFLIRFVVLIFVMILSAAAVAGTLLPKTKSMITEKWTSALIGQTIFPIIFLLFLLISFKTYDGVIAVLLEVNQITGTPDWRGVGAGIDHGMLFTYFLIVIIVLASLKIAKSVAGSSGQMVSKAGGSIIGAGIGTLAFGGRKFVGGGASLISRNIKGENAATRFAKRRLDSVANSSMDIRNSKKFASTFGGATGVDLGKGGGQGGYEKSRKANEDAAKKTFDSVGKLTPREERALMKLANEKKELDGKLEPNIAKQKELSERGAVIDTALQAKKIELEKADKAKDATQYNKISAEINQLSQDKSNVESEMSSVAAEIGKLTEQLKAPTDALKNAAKVGKDRQEKFIKDKSNPVIKIVSSVGTNDFVKNFRMQEVQKAVEKATKTPEDLAKEDQAKIIAKELADIQAKNQPSTPPAPPSA